MTLVRIQKNLQMKYIASLIILIGSINTQAQTLVKFDDIIEVVGEGKIKIYLRDIFQITYKNCADYYMLAELDDKLFQIKDSLKVFYMDDKLFQRGKYKNGQKHGNFEAFYKNGILKLISQYNNGNPIGIWKYYYDNGKLYKIVEFKDGKVFLTEMHQKNGKALVQNGFGMYDDVISLLKSGSDQYQISGAIKNGLPDGKWKISFNGSPDATEFFEGNIFMEGISHSTVIGDFKYYKNPQSTFIDATYIENLKTYGALSCHEKFDLGFSTKFFNDLKNKYKKSTLKSELINQWFFVEIEANEEGKISNVKIISRSDQQTIDQLEKMIHSIGRTFSNVRPFSGYKYFPLVIYKSNIYFQNEKEALL